MLRKILIKIANIPIVWNILQNVVGANQWKLVVYPSVFENQNGKLLDFGCSIGNTTPAFFNFDYIGLDVDSEAILAAQKRYAQHTNVKFYALDITKTKLPEKDFDHILFATAGHHIPDTEITLIIDILLTYLKPTGHLHFFDIFRQPGVDGFTTRLLTRFDQGKFIRTLEQNENIISSKKYHITKKKIFYSPDNWLIKQQDMLYLCIQPQ